MAKLNTYIHGSGRYQVIAPCVVVQLVGGGEQYVYRNGVLPAGARPANIEHLLELGMIRELEGAGA